MTPATPPAPAPNAGTARRGTGPPRRSSTAARATTPRTRTPGAHSMSYGPGWPAAKPHRLSEKPPRSRGEESPEPTRSSWAAIYGSGAPVSGALDRWLRTSAANAAGSPEFHAGAPRRPADDEQFDMPAAGDWPAHPCGMAQTWLTPQGRPPPTGQTPVRRARGGKCDRPPRRRSSRAFLAHGPRLADDDAAFVPDSNG